jgi:thymidylate synthase ThyX
MTTTSPRPTLIHHQESFSEEETAVLERFFTNTTDPVFGLINLPEVVKGALFARYSRSPKSLRRLFLDEFYETPEKGIRAIAEALDDAKVKVGRAEDLYSRVFNDYGDDSVAQLGGMHIACEQVSNVLTKVLEWGRLAAYLEQSTRYMFYDRKLGDTYRYRVPPEVTEGGLESDYRNTMDGLFDRYSRLTDALTAYYQALYPKGSDDSDFVYRSSIRARVCDDLRGLLPAATVSNVGIFASGQAYEMLLLRLRAHPLKEARFYADLMLRELRLIAPAFLKRVDVPDRGGAWSDYLEDTARAMGGAATPFEQAAPPRPEVTLVDWDPEAETKIAAAALYSVTNLPDDELLRQVRKLPVDRRGELISTYVGDRHNRRHKPGRAFERADYRFDILCDYGIFRDLQRHRLLTLEWQRLGTEHGYVIPDSIEEIDAVETWRSAMTEASGLHRALDTALGSDVAQYAVPFAFRIRFFMQMNAREAFHLLELRTGEGGHPDYRRVCQQMHRLIEQQAGHTAIAAAMKFVDHNDYGLGRLEPERRAAAKRAAAGIGDPSD